MWKHRDDEALLDEHEADIIDADCDDEFGETDILDDEAFAEDVDAEALEESAVDDFVGDSSVVFDVEDLVAEFEAEGMASEGASSRLRRRLEAIAERRRRHSDLLDFEDYDLEA